MTNILGFEAGLNLDALGNIDIESRPSTNESPREFRRLYCVSHAKSHHEEPVQNE